MIELIAENAPLRVLLLILLFVGVAAMTYFSARAMNVRQMTRRRLLADGPDVHGGTATLASLRTDREADGATRSRDSISAATDKVAQASAGGA